MPKQFKEYKATVDDGDDRRDSVIRARVSDGDESVNTLSGARAVNKGDVVVATDNPNFFDVLTSDQFKDTKYSTGSRVTENKTETLDNTTVRK